MTDPLVEPKCGGMVFQSKPTVNVNRAGDQASTAETTGLVLGCEGRGRRPFRSIREGIEEVVDLAVELGLIGHGTGTESRDQCGTVPVERMWAVQHADGHDSYPDAEG